MTADCLALAPLVAELLQSGIPVRFRAPGQSMAPTITDGSVITVEPLDGDAPVAIGEVVLVRREGRLIAHRIVAIRQLGDGVWLLLRGDAQRQTADFVPRRAVLGRLALPEPAPGRRLMRAIQPFVCLFRTVFERRI
ncbi:MAG: S26 family signal peptidase [Acidobacteriota bacterium]